VVALLKLTGDRLLDREEILSRRRKSEGIPNTGRIAVRAPKKTDEFIKKNVGEDGRIRRKGGGQFFLLQKP